MACGQQSSSHRGVSTPAAPGVHPDLHLPSSPSRLCTRGQTEPNSGPLGPRASAQGGCISIGHGPTKPVCSEPRGKAFSHPGWSTHRDTAHPVNDMTTHTHTHSTQPDRETHSTHNYTNTDTLKRYLWTQACANMHTRTCKHAYTCVRTHGSSSSPKIRTVSSPHGQDSLSPRIPPQTPQKLALADPRPHPGQRCGTAPPRGRP